MKIGERIKQERKALNLSQADLAHQCGWEHQSRISGYETGAREPDLDDLGVIAAALGKSISELLSPSGRVAENGPATYSTTGPGPDIRPSVPLISRVQAGEWGEAADPYPPGVGEEMINPISRVGPHAFALRVKGDSMTSPVGLSIPEGYVVIVDPDASYENGSIIVAKLEDDDEAMLKKLVIDGPNKYLRALNPTYGPIEINGNCRIVGVVKDIILQIT